MVRAYDLVVGKKKSLTDVEPKDESSKQAAPKQTETEEAALAEARMSLRLSEIDILKLKSGNQQKIPVHIKIEEKIIIETPQASPAI